MRTRRPVSVARLMGWVAACGLALGLLRSSLGEVFALAAGGVVGCGLAPWFACIEMNRVPRLGRGAAGTLAGYAEPAEKAEQRRQASVRAQACLLTFAAWLLAGLAVATAGVALARVLRPS